MEFAMIRSSSALVTLVIILVSASPRAQQGVTSEQLAAGPADPTKWLIYRGDYGGQPHSPLTQLTPAIVGYLSVQWAFQTGVLGKFEATPIVVDGMIDITGPNSTAWALDARTGRQIWSYRRELPDGLSICCG